MARELNFKLFGPWGHARKIFKNLPANLKSISLSSQRSIAEKFAREVKAHLKNQDIPGWTPLSYRYANKKLTKLGSTDILIASWEYYNNIKSWRENNLYHVGVKRGVRYKGGLEISRVAAIHESWSRVSNKPYRPLWGYTFNKDLGGNRGISKLINKHFKERLISKGYPVKVIKL